MQDLISEYLEVVRLFRRYLEEKRGMEKREKKEDPQILLENFYQSMKNCKLCNLYKTRTNIVFGEGNPRAPLMLVGEAPGRDEDLRGKPFVGAAGQLLRESLKKEGISNDKIYIANVIKCRPPGNRDPKPEEISACLPYLREQIKIINPKIICTLGKFSTQVLLNTIQGITRLRGKVYQFNDTTIIIPTFHPAALIYRAPWKATFQEDLKLVKRNLDNLSS